MKLIIESGSTKTCFRLINGYEIILFSDSDGINPIFKPKNEIIDQLKSLLNKILTANDKLEIYFYGAGCSLIENQNIVKDSILQVFPRSNVSVESDIVASAYACLGNEVGIAAILGTGANICEFDGSKVTLTRSGIGYILGDEGSGAHLGKTLIQDYLNNEIPSLQRELFDEEFNLSTKDIINLVYKSSDVNLFFAGFSKFIYKNINNNYFYSLAKKCLTSFFEMHIEKMDNYENKKIGIVGSVAFYYQDIIRDIAKEKGISIFRIIEKPIDALVEFHLRSS